MRIGFIENHKSNENGDPTGGVTVGTGFTIAWQDGPLGRGEDRKAPNGAFVEDVIDACIGRIRHYQESHFRCASNAAAIVSLTSALAALDSRTKDREARGVEGEHKE